MDWSWLAWVGSIAVGAGGLYTAYMGRNKPASDSAKNISDAASSLVTTYRDEVKNLRSELDAAKVDFISRLNAKDAELNRINAQANILTARVNELSAGVGVLVVQIENAGLTPLWRPKLPDKK